MFYDRKPKRVDAVKSGDSTYVVHDLEANTTTSMSALEFEADFVPVTPRPRQKLDAAIDKLKGDMARPFKDKAA